MLILRGERARKNLILWSTFAKKCLTPFLACIFKILPARKKVGQKQSFLVLRESSENQFGREKKSELNELQFFDVFNFFLITILGPINGKL